MFMLVSFGIKRTKKNYKIVYFNLYCTISAFGKANKFDFAHYKPVTL